MTASRLPLGGGATAAGPRRRGGLPGDGRRLPRILHPVAWWLWAGSLAVVAYSTTNPLLLVLVLAVAGYVVAARRQDAPWARAFRYYFAFGISVVAIRIVFRTVFGGDTSATGHVLVHLPAVPLPSWAAGIQLGGPVTLESTLAALYDGLRLATMLCCIGAANALANPKRALRVLPGALYELGVAVVVAITVAPQLVDSGQRVLKARRLRGGGGRGVRALRSVVVPVLQDALDRSLRLAAAMDSRGYGRRAEVSDAHRRATSALMILGLAGLCLGMYGLHSGSSPAFGLPAIVVGASVCVAGLVVGGRRVRHTSYRPDPWRWPEWAVAACGVGSAALVTLTGHLSGYEDGLALNPPTDPLTWPPLPGVGLLAILLAGVAAFAAPPAPTGGDRGLPAIRPADVPLRPAEPQREMVLR